ncbi:hypothetical protein NPIL_638791 [Nephila pilipes]|uniref:Uncharacterized protein n=1 Tax=Nephila pilipes TaxID=299642 RepID=A0A8X6UDZ9_NEPPI|nr:hypothetical protein NPIL_638791 [Nephila pilipes]
MLCHFEKAVQSLRDLNELFGEMNNQRKSMQGMICHFTSGETSLKDKPEKGLQSDFDYRALLAAVEEEKSLITRQI